MIMRRVLELRQADVVQLFYGFKYYLCDFSVIERSDG